MIKLLLNYLAFLFLFSVAVSAQIPKTMSYQGVLEDTSGNAVADGNYNLTFRIYDVTSGGTELWMETQSIPVVDGIFNAILGSATPLNLSFDQPYWLGISVDGGTELSPRIELTSVPYSLEPDSGGAGDGHSLDAADGDPMDVVYVDNDGKVGIGTTIPNETLVVGNSTDAINQNIRVRSQKDVALILEADTDNASEDDNPYISFLQDGSIVEGIVGMAAGAGVGPDGSPMTDVGANALVLANKYATSSQSRIQFMTNDGTDVGARMTINGEGQVGIGVLIPNPDTKLHVESHRKYAGYFTSDSLSSDTHVIHAESNGSSDPDDVIAIYGKSVPAPFYGNGGYFEGGWKGVEAYAIEPGSGNRYGVFAGGSNGGNSNYGVRGFSFGGITTYGVYGDGSGGSSNNYAVYAGGDLAYTGSLINASDAKLKENIQPLASSLNKLMQLKPKSFNFTGDAQYAHMNLPTGEHYGLIAQEVERVFPELVSNNRHPSSGETRGERSDESSITYKGLNYMELIPVMIQAIKEQQMLIEKQQKENETQQEKINLLESKVNQLTNN